MTNPLPRPGPDDALSADTAAAHPVKGAGPARKAPRRATAPAGPPVRAAAPALLVLDDAGMILPAQASPPPETYDAGTSPSPAPAAAGAVGEDARAAGGSKEVKPGNDTFEVGKPGTAGWPAAAGPEMFRSAGAKPDPAPAEPLADVPAESARAATDATAEADTLAPAPESGVYVPPAETVEGPAAERMVEAAAQTSPQSRRERRLAEQGPGPGVVPAAVVAKPAATAPGVAHTPAPDTASATPAPAPRKRNRVLATLRGLLFLSVISALVIGLGTVVSGKDVPTAGPSQTEAHRLAGWENTAALLRQTTELAAAGTEAKLARLLASTAHDLQLQLSALGDGLPTAAATAEAAPAAPAGVEAVVKGLQANGEELLASAVSADHAMGRVFAAAGTGQLLQGQALGDAAGLAPSGSLWLPATVDFVLPAGPVCGSTLAPRPGVTVDAALRAAADGEQKAVYAYQVATPRIADPQSRQAHQMLAGHQAKLELLNAELAVRCLPEVAPVPGYAVDPSLLSTPESALAALEGQLAAGYADLAALSTAPAVPLAGAAAPAAETEAAAGTVPAPTSAAATSLLRQMSVTWLLDSTRSQRLWGGPVVALPGIDTAPVAATP